MSSDGDSEQRLANWIRIHLTIIQGKDWGKYGLCRARTRVSLVLTWPAWWHVTSHGASVGEVLDSFMKDPFVALNQLILRVLWSCSSCDPALSFARMRTVLQSAVVVLVGGMTRPYISVGRKETGRMLLSLVATIKPKSDLEVENHSGITMSSRSFLYIN